MTKLFIILAILIAPFLAFGQSNRCATEDVFNMEAQVNPGLKESRIQYDEWLTKTALNYTQNKISAVPKIIPVVVHVIHEYGGENISKEQIQDQIRILNEDFRRLNADTINTPSVFNPVAADCNIEFKLAQIDPNGNCTDGIVRVYSPLTNHSLSDAAQLKALSRWPNSKYLNYWVVKSMSGVLGYATFPGGNNQLDGIVCGHNYTGSIGTAAIGSYNLGRTATHEVGHWLGLRHIWGDSNCGDDFISDTPTQATSNFGCKTFPNVTCNNGPNGDMFMNYMDYSDDVCFNIFTTGQCARMNTVLNNGVSGRNNLWTQSNLIATGTDGSPPGVCNLIADISNIEKNICTGDSIIFTDHSWNGDIDTWQWSFPGGTPSTSSLQNPTIYYNSPGVYNVTLTVSNAAGSDSITRQNVIIVRPVLAQHAVPFTEDFEAAAVGTLPLNYFQNNNAGNNFWETTNNASVSGNNSVYINNFSGNNNGDDEFITSSYNFSNVTGVTMNFDYAYAVRSTSLDGQLKIFASNDCGNTWSLRYNKQGSVLSTAGIIQSNFIPSSGDWVQETVNLSTSSVSGRDHILFKFQFINRGGNNIFIDDINLSGTVGVNELSDDNTFYLSPNPSSGETFIDLNLKSSQIVNINVFDTNGKKLTNIINSLITKGLHKIPISTTLSSGVYFVTLQTQTNTISKKLIIIN